jgi:hypothetical protein
MNLSRRYHLWSKGGVMLHVTSAEYVGAYKIWVEFSNGHSGIIDLEDDLWGPVFEPLKDMEKFRKFRVSDVLHTLVWENDADLAPEYLYDKLSDKLKEAG